jgi:ABC-type uncharacterized transport system fused permease/ATPase subunit
MNFIVISLTKLKSTLIKFIANLVSLMLNLIKSIISLIKPIVILKKILVELIRVIIQYLVTIQLIRLSFVKVIIIGCFDYQIYFLEPPFCSNLR